MAQYKVPQDVEADDKLLGPFSFRQFIYLLIAGGMVALAVALFQLFPLLAVIPVPVIFFFSILALPLKKDQPMETYLAALLSFYLKPRKRFWVSGQREFTINITAPKLVERPSVRDLSPSEASHRLSFLADVIDSEGQSVLKTNTTPMRDEFAAEANNIVDIFDNKETVDLDKKIVQETASRHQKVVQQLQATIRQQDSRRAQTAAPSIQKHSFGQTVAAETTVARPQPVAPAVPTTAVKPAVSAATVKSTSVKAPKPAIIELANSSDFSIETIQKEANRINQLKDEVYISLH